MGERPDLHPANQAPESGKDFSGWCMLWFPGFQAAETEKEQSCEV
jgi:hypothetical protein